MAAYVLVLEAAGDTLKTAGSLSQDPLDGSHVVVAVAEVMVEGREAVRLALLGDAPWVGPFLDIQQFT